MKKQAQNIFTIVLLGVAAFAFISVMLFLAKGVFSILSFLAPAMLIGAFIVNHKVVLQFGNFLMTKLKTNPLAGVAYIAGTFFLFPLVSALLLVAAFGSKKLQGIFESAGMEASGSQRAEEAEFEIIEDDAEFEIFDEEPETLLLPEEDKLENKPNTSSKYEDLF